MTPEELAEEYHNLYEYYAQRMFGRIGEVKWEDVGEEEKIILTRVAKEILKRNGWFVDVEVGEEYL